MRPRKARALQERQGLASSTSLRSTACSCFARSSPLLWVCALVHGTPTLKEAVVGTGAEAAGPRVEGVHHHGQQPPVLKAPRQHLQSERSLLGAQGLEEKRPGVGWGLRARRLPHVLGKRSASAPLPKLSGVPAP